MAATALQTVYNTNNAPGLYEDEFSKKRSYWTRANIELAIKLNTRYSYRRCCLHTRLSKPK